MRGSPPVAPAAAQQRTSSSESPRPSGDAGVDIRPVQGDVHGAVDDQLPAALLSSVDERSCAASIAASPSPTADRCTAIAAGSSSVACRLPTGSVGPEDDGAAGTWAVGGMSRAESAPAGSISHSTGHGNLHRRIVVPLGLTRSRVRR